MFTSKQGFVSKEPRVERLENNFARLFGRRLSLQAMRLAAVFVGTSSTILRGSITLREFSVVKARKPVVFPCENSWYR